MPLVLGRRARGLSSCRAEITAGLRSLCSLLLLAGASPGNGNLAGGCGWLETLFLWLLDSPSHYICLQTCNVISFTVLCRKLSLFLFKYWGNRACYLVKDLCKWLFVSHDWALQSVSYIDNAIMPLLPFQSSTLWRSLQFLDRIGMENLALLKSTFILQ